MVDPGSAIDDWSYRPGMLKICKRCGEIGHLARERGVCGYGACGVNGVDDVMCVECGRDGHGLLACLDLGFRPLAHAVHRLELVEWVRQAGITGFRHGWDYLHEDWSKGLHLMKDSLWAHDVRRRKEEEEEDVTMKG